MSERIGTATIEIETPGMDEALEKAERLSELMEHCQVSIKNPKNCTFNIHPSQIITMPEENKS